MKKMWVALESGDDQMVLDVLGNRRSESEETESPKVVFSAFSVAIWAEMMLQRSPLLSFL